MATPIDLRDPFQLALLIAIGALLVIFLWLLRVLLNGGAPPDAFGPWQPLYPAPAQPNLDTLDGRRYLWQGHAQNDGAVLPLPCAPGAVLARKRAIGAAGQPLAGWRIVGVRTGRYDSYGRIARTHHLLRRRELRALERAARRPRLSQKAAARAVRPVARALVRDALRHNDDRTGMLPIAIDVRLRSEKPGALVAFELVACQEGGWVLLDTWSSAPSLGSRGEAVEQFTYALPGTTFDEDTRAVRRRLEAQLGAILAGLVAKGPPPAAPTPTEANLLA